MFGNSYLQPARSKDYLLQPCRLRSTRSNERRNVIHSVAVILRLVWNNEDLLPRPAGPTIGVTASAPSPRTTLAKEVEAGPHGWFARSKRYPGERQVGGERPEKAHSRGRGGLRTEAPRAHRTGRTTPMRNEPATLMPRLAHRNSRGPTATAMSYLTQCQQRRQGQPGPRSCPPSWLSQPRPHGWQRRPLGFQCPAYG